MEKKESNDGKNFISFDLQKWARRRVVVGNLRKGITVVLQIAAYNLLVLYLVLHLLRLETWITTREREGGGSSKVFSSSACASRGSISFP